MNKSLESIRGSWITRDRENAEQNRNFVRSMAEQIPTEVREKILSIVERAEQTEKFCDLVIDVTGRDTDNHIQEIMFLESHIMVLISEIRSAHDLALREIASETIQRMQDRAYQEEQKRLSLTYHSTNPQTVSNS
jgi:hypothetical protein